MIRHITGRPPRPPRRRLRLSPPPSSLFPPSPSPPHTNVVPSWQDHQAARSSAAQQQQYSSGSKAVALSQPAKRVHYQNCPPDLSGDRDDRPFVLTSRPSLQEGERTEFLPRPSSLDSEQCNCGNNVERRTRCKNQLGRIVRKYLLKPVVPLIAGRPDAPPSR